MTAACAIRNLDVADGAVGARCRHAKIEAGNPGAVSDAMGLKDKLKDKDKDKRERQETRTEWQPHAADCADYSWYCRAADELDAPVPSTKTVPRRIDLGEGQQHHHGEQPDVSVPSSAVIRHGSKTYSSPDLRVGNRVHVKATRAGGHRAATAARSWWRPRVGAEPLPTRAPRWR